ncbi:DUF11 domain-containing protein [Alphaproteobacteria bacterium]|nr:DUF11 domain-containing protein [Alphaproteobacteria bacterium]
MKNQSSFVSLFFGKLAATFIILVSFVFSYLGMSSHAHAQNCPAGMEFFDNLLEGSSFVFPSQTAGSTTDNFGRTWTWALSGETNKLACGTTPTLNDGRIQHCYDWDDPGDGITVSATVSGGIVTNPVIYLADIDGGAPGLGWQDEFSWVSPAATAYTPAQNPYSFDIVGNTFTGNANNADNSNTGAGSLLVSTGTNTSNFSWSYQAGPDTNPPGGQFVWVSMGSCMSVTPEVSKVVNAPATVYPGDTVTYTVTITSPDDWDVVYDGFTDTIGSALEITSIDTVNSTCAFKNDGVISAASPGNTASWTSGAPYYILRGQSCNLIYAAVVDPNVNMGSPASVMTCDSSPGDANDNFIDVDFNYGTSNTNILSGSSNVTANTCVVITPRTPELTVVKTASAATYSAVGDVITYTYEVENSGNVAITEDILIQDNKLASDVTCTTADLAISAKVTCTATYTIDQADLDAGAVTNVAFAKSSYNGSAVNSATDTVTVNAVQNPAITIDKTTTTTNYDATSDTVSYSYEVTNSGNVTITQAITVADDKTTTTCPALPGGSLAPGASITCTASYTIEQADIDTGSLTNVASASTSFGGNAVNSGTDTVTVNAVQNPAISIDKTASSSTYDATTDTITYSYKVTNSGNVTITQAVAVSDDKTTATCPTLPVGGLAPAAFLTCTASFSISQSDLDGGSVTNIASASSAFGGNPVNSSTDTVTVNAIQSPALTLDKTANAASYDATTDTISYSYKVTNSGNVTITQAITVTDDKTTVTCPGLPIGGLAPSAFVTCTASYSILQSDIDGGSLTNIASGASGFGGIPVNTNSDTVTLTAVQTPALFLNKSSPTSSYAVAIQSISYSYQVTNSGNVTLTTAITVVDDKTTVTCPALPVGGLAPGGVVTCAASYTTVQADMDTGSVMNTATASSAFDGNPVDSNQDVVTVNAFQAPALSLDKTSQEVSYSVLGEQLNYTYTVTNTGNVTITSAVTIADDKATVSCPSIPAGGFAPGNFMTCTASHSVTQADLDAGAVTNLATANTSFGGNPVASNQDSVTITGMQNPTITLAKTTTTADYDDPSDVLSYSYEITNSGNVTLTQAFSVSDDKTTVTCPALPAGGLAPLSSLTCTATYTALQADIDTGSVVNVATAGTTYNSNPVASNSDSVTINAVQNPALTLDKSTLVSDYAVVGQSLDYSYLVTNSGNTTVVDPITVNDDKTTVTCPALPAGGLAPSNAITCIASYIVTQADIDSGSVTNIATATDSNVTTPSDTVTVNAFQNPALTLDKTTQKSAISIAGEPVAYTYTVTNTGNITVTDPVTVSDDKTTVTCPSLTTGGLAPGSFMTCTASYIVLQSDLDAGSLTNIATASAGALDSNTDTVTVVAFQQPALALDKTTQEVAYDTVGEALDYTYTVTNIGNVTFTGALGVTDDKTAVTCPVLTAPGLLPGGFVTCTATYAVVQADLDLGSVTNTAEASAVFNSVPVTSNQDSVTITAIQGPALSLDVTTTTADFDEPGDVIDYSYEVTNSGNTTITDPITVAGDHASPITCPALPMGGLAPGSSVTCTGSYAVDQADVDAGSVTNDAVATDTNVSSNNDGVTVAAIQTLAITLDVTTTTPDFNEPGDVIDYSYEVTNSGNVTITDPIAVMGDHASPITCPALPMGGLAPGSSVTCTGSYAVDQADVDAGSVTNDAVATDGGVISNTDGVMVSAVQNPEITLDVTTTTANFDEPGDLIDYDYEITNTGNTTLTDPISVTGDHASPITCPSLPVGGLVPGASVTCTGSYAVDQADIDAGSVTNDAIATDGNINSNSDGVTVNAVQTPQITLDVTTTTPNYDEPGDVIDYDYEVRNSGNTTITTAVSVTGDHASPINCPMLPAAGLAPGASVTCTGSYSVDQADVDAGSVTNDAVATSGTLTSNTDGVTVDAIQNPELTLVVTTTTPDFDEPGDVVDYSYLVTNSGNTTITDPITVTDPHGNPVSCDPLPAGGLVLGASITCTGSYAVDQGDLDAGSVTNDAVATDGNTDSNNDGVSVNAVQTPEITLAVTTTTSDFDKAGDIIDYIYEVTNSGNTSITDPITITDPHGNPVTCDPIPAGGLLPGQNITCSGTYTVDQDDVDVGEITNDAVATDGVLNTNNDGVTVFAIQNPALDLEKTAATVSYASVGDLVTYSYEVMNAGNVTFTHPISVADNKATVSCPALPAGGLVPTASIICSATYAVTQEDIDDGFVTNVATAGGLFDGQPIASNQDEVTVNAIQTPALTLDVTSPTADFDEPGDVIDYTYEVTNSGNTSITDPISVTDPHGNPVTCDPLPSGGLLPGQSITCTGSYVVDQDDLMAGSVTNDAVATDGSINSNNDGVSVEGLYKPALKLEVTATPTEFDEPGDVIVYTYVVTNSGNSIFTDPITVTDPHGNPVTCDPLPAGGLLPGQTITCTGSYTVDQDDVDAGSITNEATASDGMVDSDPAGTTVNAVQNPNLTIEKTADKEVFLTIGETINYSFLVTNSGNTTITAEVTINDDKATATCPALTDGRLNVGVSITCTASYVVTEDDFLAGSVVNVATATAGNFTSVADEVTVASGTSSLGAGKVLQEVVNLRDGRFQLTYILTVTNTGTGSLINVAVLDEMQNGSGDFEDLQPTSLSASLLTGDLLNSIDVAFTPSAAWAGEANVNVIADDQDLTPGQTGGVLISVTIEPMGAIDTVINTAVAKAFGAGGLIVSDASSAEFVGSTANDSNTSAPLEVNPVISTVKETIGDPTFIGNGEYKISYRITMANIGDIVLRKVQLADNLAAVFQTALVRVENVVLVSAPTGFIGDLNTDYDGLTDVNLLDALGELKAPIVGDDIGDSLIVTFDVVFAPANPFFEYENVAIASGDAPITGVPVEATGAASLLVDPNGIVYDSVTGLPIANAKVEMVDGANVPLPPQCVVSGQQGQVTDNTGFYRFDVDVTGNDPSCPLAGDELRLVVTAPDNYSFTSVIVPPVAGIYDPTACPAPAVLVGTECQFSASWTVQAASAPPYYLRFELEPGDPDVVRNHIPLDFLPAAGSIAVQKRALLPVASVGDTILYELQVTNLSAAPMTTISIVDQPPAGFSYLANTAVASSTVTARQVEPTQSGNQLIWSIAGANAAPMDTLGAGETLTIEYRLQVSGAVDLGSYKNSASVLNNLNATISNIAEATVRIEADPLLDCPEVIGQVFNDTNLNGYQDQGEKGIAAARMMTARGEIVTSDEHGRFHVSCALIPNKNRGSNFILKLDPRSLPTGYRITSENPRVVRLTRGKMTKLNFGASISKVIRLEIDDRGFTTGSDELTPAAIEATKLALEEVADEQITLRLIYVSGVSNSDLVNRRIDSLATWVQNHWNRSDRRTRLDREQLELEIIDHSNQRLFKQNVAPNTEQFFASDTIATVDLSNQPLVRLSLDGRPKSAVPAVAKEDDDRTIDVALAKSQMRVTSSSLDVSRALNVTGRVVKTENGREIQFFPYWNYGAWIDRAEVRLFKDGESVQGTPDVAIEVDPMMKARALLQGGEEVTYRYVLRVYDEAGRFDQTAPKTLVVPVSGQEEAASGEMDLSGYGRNTIQITGITVNGGAVTVSGHSVPVGTEVLVMGRMVPVSADGAFVVQEILPNGTHNVTLALMDQVAEGEEAKGLEFQRRVRVNDQDFIAVALADVTVGGNWGDTTTDEEVYVDGRLAFYFKGKVKGGILITAMADTEEGNIESLIDDIDKRDARSLIKRLDPDRYYNVYGDNSQIEDDAPTSGKLYVRVEKDKSYGLWGNFQTGFNDTEYGRLDRSLYGAKGVYKSQMATSAGEPLTGVKAFAANPGTLAAQDRFRGTGGSVYFLRRNDITIGSEQLRVEVVDRTSGIVSQSRQLVYGTDYDIDYLQGRIILSHALSSTVEDGSLFSDGNLSGHHMYLVADYEYVSSSVDQDDFLYGGRASQWIGDYVRLGVPITRTRKMFRITNFGALILPFAFSQRPTSR